SGSSGMKPVCMSARAKTVCSQTCRSSARACGLGWISSSSSSATGSISSGFCRHSAPHRLQPAWLGRF
ncbi:hypothetical protein, partial [Klebsiella pneumoniae]|uniref:hypothetical protein n=1 Tax=Klebsiella pneumoniae TaxID=573 RepID=UPI001E59705A